MGMCQHSMWNPKCRTRKIVENDEKKNEEKKSSVIPIDSRYKHTEYDL